MYKLTAKAVEDARNARFLAKTSNGLVCMFLEVELADDELMEILEEENDPEIAASAGR